jgi:hypothetical protein
MNKHEQADCLSGSAIVRTVTIIELPCEQCESTISVRTNIVYVAVRKAVATGWGSDSDGRTLCPTCRRNYVET